MPPLTIGWKNRLPNTKGNPTILKNPQAMIDPITKNDYIRS